MLKWTCLDLKQECRKEQLRSDGSPSPKGLGPKPEGQLSLEGELSSLKLLLFPLAPFRNS